MKKLELASFGVTEMNTREMEQLTGGSVDWLSLVSPTAALIFGNWDDIKQGVKVFATEGGRNAGLVVR